MSQDINAIVIAEVPSFKIEAFIKGEALLLKPSGTINEDFNFSKALEVVTQLHPAKTQILFDLSHVIAINSCGVRSWILFTERLQSKLPLRFTRVNELFIEQAAIVPTVLGKKGTP